MSGSKPLAWLVTVFALGCSDTGPVPFVYDSPGGGGACSTSYSFDSADCDTCMRQACCGTLQQCDGAGACVDVNNCGTSSCDSATDLVSCMDQACSAYGASSVNSWAALYTCERTYCAGPCGTGGGSCPTSVSFSNADCDTCARNSCCGALQSCDVGSGCYDVDQCRQSYCTGYSGDEMFACVSNYCSGYAYDAIQQWNSYWSCLAGSCRGTCVQ